MKSYLTEYQNCFHTKNQWYTIIIITLNLLITIGEFIQVANNDIASILVISDDNDDILYRAVIYVVDKIAIDDNISMKHIMQ